MDIFSSDRQESIKKRERTGEVPFIYKTFIFLENIVNILERLSHNLVENEKEAGMSDKSL